MDSSAKRTSHTYRLGDVIALLRRAPMSASYKPALLRALVRRVAVATGDIDTIPLTDLANEYLRLYWNHTVVFRLRHSPRDSARPEIQQRIEEASVASGERRLENLSPAIHKELVSQIARVLTINVLTAFHSSRPATMKPLYEWAQGSKVIQLMPGAANFARENAEALTVVANFYWARFLTRLNNAPRIIDKLERLEIHRAALAKFAAIFTKVGDSRCFYCDREFIAENSMKVDHFVPWAFAFEDKIWNLVPACPSCNTRKSDQLADEQFLVKLLERNRRLRTIKTFPLISELRIVESRDAELADLYKLARTEGWPGSWVPT